MGIIVVSLVALKPEKIAAKNVITALVLAVLLGGATFVVHKSAVPSGKYDTFAQCLTEKRLYMYGSISCSFCAKQRAMFGDSFQYVNEIECDPRNPNHEAQRCIEKNVERTPTWIFDDSEGGILYRFEPGVVSFEELSEISGCPLIED